MHPKAGYPRFLFVIDNLSTGGAQRQLINLAIGMIRRGYAVEVFCYMPGDMLAQPLYDTGVPVHWHIKRSRFSFDVILNLRRTIQERHYDLALSFLSTPNFYTVFSGRFLNKRRFPVVLSERFCDLPGLVNRFERISRYFYPYADRVVFNSHHQRLTFEKKYPNLRGRLSTIYNGYDLDVFSPALVEPDNHPLKILVIASVSPYKNGLCLIEAAEILKRECDLMPEIDWIGQRVMAGDRLAYFKEMENKIQQYQLERRWRWLDQRSDIVDQLHRHDVLVHASFGEGLPNVVCEALACARPVIVSNTLDHPRIVQEGYSGYLFDWQDPSDLAKKIRKFSDLPVDKRKEMGQNGRRFAEQNLALGRYVDEYEHLFLSILNQ